MSRMEPIRNNRTLSLHLSRVLDGAGVSERTVNKRRQTWLTTELTANLVGMDELGMISYCFGSQIEGSTTSGLDSDFDLLYHSNNDTAIQSMREWTPGKTNMLVLQGGDIPAGYCHLQLLSRPISLSTLMVTGSSSTRDDEGRVLLKHNLFSILEHTQHGPARRIPVVKNNYETDYVSCFKCGSVSKQVEPWIRRMQNKQWPTRDMLKTATESGFFIVPVGHRLSETRDEHVEWRVSPSLTERCLMFGMNITQMQCYVILKMIKTDLIIPKIGEGITSFHLKNVLFHCIENTPNELWSVENLFACIDICLNYLLSFVQKRSCPNYLIPGENLLSGKLTEDKISNLKKLLYKLIESDGCYLFRIKCDGVGDLLYDKCLNRPSTIDPVRFVLDEVCPLEGLETEAIITQLKTCERLAARTSLNTVRGTMGKLRNIQKSSDDLTSSVATSILQILYSTYGSMLAAMCIRGGIGLTKGALSYLERGCGYDLMSGRLKKASALYCCGRYREAASVLEDLDSRYDYRCVQPVCACHRERTRYIKQEFERRVYFDDTTSDNNELVACHVAFTSREIHCCPIALRFDLHRGLGEDRALRDPVFDSWMYLAAVDSVIFLYFLMYLTYGSLGNRHLQRNALSNLSSSLSTKDEQDYIRHYETAFNLLGQCYEMEGEPGEALLCYRISLEHMPRNNSALWHVALLIYKHFWRRLFVNRYLSLTFENV